MKTILALALGGLTLAGAAAAQDGDVDAGRKVANMCRTCHGANGYAQIPIAPHIGGEPQTYLAGQLLAFKSGARAHEMMTVVAAGLSDTQIADVAAWYAAQQAVATLTADPDLAPMACAGCHGVDGIAVIPDAPNLAGETNIYIETQLKAFRDGKRDSDIMAGIAGDLSNEEMREIANWFAAIGLEIVPAE